MTKLDNKNKMNLIAQGLKEVYPWNTTIYTGLMGEAVNGLLSLINQIVYYNNPNPKFKTPTPYTNSSSKLYIRMGKNALSSTIAIGNPFI